MVGGGSVRAVDVGASPGGWTQFLAPKCHSVLAVDPVSELVNEWVRVIHITPPLLLYVASAVPVYYIV